MKDATGELSMTAIAIVAIAAIAGVFAVFILPRLRTNIGNSVKCQSAFGCTGCDGQTCQCLVYTDDSGTETENIVCEDKTVQE